MSLGYIVVIGGGILQIPCIKECQNLGFSVIVVDGNKKAPGMFFAAIPLVISINDNGTILKEIKKLSLLYPIKGVLTQGTDRSLIVAQIAEMLNLPGISPQTALNCSNKFEMRKKLKENGIPVPDFYIVKTKEEAALYFSKIKSKKAVIKPIDNMGARGVKQIFSEKDASEAFESTCAFSSDKTVLIEEFLDGKELSVDSLIFNEQFFECGVADRLIEKDPYFIEIGHNLPSSLDIENIKGALSMLKKASHVLGITHGVAKGDIKITPNGPRIVEIAARLSGGFMSGYTFPYATGINLSLCAVKLAIGEFPSTEDLTPTKKMVSVERGLIPFSLGTYKTVENIDKALKIPFIKNIFITASPFKKFTSIENNVDKIGHIIATAPSLKEASTAVDEALKILKIIMEPS